MSEGASAGVMKGMMCPFCLNLGLLACCHTSACWNTWTPPAERTPELIIEQTEILAALIARGLLPTTRRRD